MKLTFALFRNDKKQGNQPDYRSPMKTPILITEPGEYRVAGWAKEKDGTKFLSCILEKVDPNQAPFPSRDQNVAMIQKTRAELDREQGQAPQNPTYPPGWRAPKADNTRYPSPQRPPDPVEDLPF